ncbi:50S ribosomal protein L23 [Candidatus Parcubacteria bacterium]|nr:MAG: 50S ribosomal protein L23 [Candidatus Parcubacteria bacterium]
MGLFGKKKATDDKKAEEKKAVDVKVAKKEPKEENKTAPVAKKVGKKIVARKESRPGSAYRVLIRPIISEKATIGASQNKYVFEVYTDANKVEIKKAVLEIYGVMPESVNIINHRGKSVRFGRKFGRTKDVKKAVVTLKKGDNIKLYEGI